MTYILVEGNEDVEALKAVLPPSLLKAVNFVVADGRYNIQSLASTLLVTRQQPLIVVFDAETLNVTHAHEMR